MTAAGRPADLTQAGGVEVVTAEGVKRFDQAGREDVPGIIASLVATGERIYEVRVLRSTLEDVYLEAVQPEP